MRSMDLIAHALYAHDTMPTSLTPAKAARDWMDETPNAFANRCLPLLMANQGGWEIVQQGGFTATWHSSPYPHDITIEKDDPFRYSGWYPLAHFGGGILTWHIPWLFRTPPGWNLLLRGPANRPKDGVSPLEGLIETDWATQTTTYSVKITRPDHPIHYDDGEPVAMIVPMKRDDLEEWTPRIQPLDDSPELESEVAAFAQSRGEFNAGPRQPREWQRHYSQGKAPGGAEAPVGEHRKRRRLKEFEVTPVQPSPK